MRKDNNQRDTQEHGLRIQVHGGLHEGAESLLGAQQITVIGSAIDCDLHLCDAGVAAHHLAIGVSDGHFVARPMDAQCSVNGRRVSAGQSASIVCGDRIELHDTGVSLVTAEQSAPGQQVGDDAADLECTDGEPLHDERPRRSKLYACAVLVTVIALGAAFGSQRLMSKNLPSPDALSSATTVLETLAIADVVTMSDAAGVVTLSGVLPAGKSASLERALQSLPENIVNRTQSESRLLEQVRGVFRTNGYHAELDYVGDGTVQVTNLDGENPRIQEIAAHARDDVSVLQALTFAPVVDPDRSGKRLAVYSTDPDKRLTTIVDGDTAYVATTDGGRYFVGSVLPGGLVLRDISADGIQVDDNGEIHWLAL